MRFEMAPEINHYYATYDDTDGIGILFEHTESADIAMTQGDGDLDALGRPCDPALRGLYGFPMSPDRTTFLVFDPDTGRGRPPGRAARARPAVDPPAQRHGLEHRGPQSTRPLHHTVHQGWRPEAITQKMLALYGDRVDRTLLPSEETAPLVVTTSMPDLDVGRGARAGRWTTSRPRRSSCRATRAPTRRRAATPAPIPAATTAGWSCRS